MVAGDRRVSLVFLVEHHAFVIPEITVHIDVIAVELTVETWCHRRLLNNKFSF